MGSVIIVNASESAVYAFMSNYSGGSDSWYELQPGHRDSWSRDGWELAAFKDVDDTQRAGVYVPADQTVTFYGFGDIRIE